MVRNGEREQVWQERVAQWRGEQRLLLEEMVDTDLAANNEELGAHAPVKRQRKRAGRQPLPTHLEHTEHRHEPELCHRTDQNLTQGGRLFSCVVGHIGIALLSLFGRAQWTKYRAFQAGLMRLQAGSAIYRMESTG